MDSERQLIKKKFNYYKLLKVFTYFCLAFSLISTVTYMIYTILVCDDIQGEFFQIISVILLAIFSVLFVIIRMFARTKKIRIFLIICSLLLSFYSIFQVIYDITTSKDQVLDFTNQDIQEVVKWANERNILVEQQFQNSEDIPQYKVISQDVKAGTPSKKIKNLKLIVSDGIDPMKTTTITNMVGWKLDDVIQFIDENHLTNVTIDFKFDDKVGRDLIISQDIIQDIKRNEPIHLVSSLGEEEDFSSITMDDLVGLDLFHADIYCGRNHLDCSIEYAYSEDKEEDTILKQNIKKWTIISPKDKVEIILTVAKQNEITVPDLNKLTVSQITTWATNNRLKIDFTEEYDDSIKLGKIVSSNYKKGNTVKIGDTIKIVISKGPLYMIKFTTVESFIKWAQENNVIYNIDYQYHDRIEKGKLVSTTHKENQLIKNNDTINLIISQGNNTFIPNLIGMTKEEASDSCQKAQINCKFILLDGNSDSPIVSKQSMRKGSNVPINTTITVTLD